MGIFPFLPPSARPLSHPRPAAPAIDTPGITFFASTVLKDFLGDKVKKNAAYFTTVAILFAVTVGATWVCFFKWQKR